MINPVCPPATMNLRRRKEVAKIYKSMTINRVAKIGRALLPKKIALINVTTMSSDLQGMIGRMTRVIRRCRQESMIRLPATPRILQTNPINSGITDLPCRPIRFMKGSKI